MRLKATVRGGRRGEMREPVSEYNQDAQQGWGGGGVVSATTMGAEVRMLQSSTSLWCLFKAAAAEIQRN